MVIEFQWRQTARLCLNPITLTTLHLPRFQGKTTIRFREIYFNEKLVAFVTFFIRALFDWVSQKQNQSNQNGQSELKKYHKQPPRAQNEDEKLPEVRENARD